MSTVNGPVKIRQKEKFSLRKNTYSRTFSIHQPCSVLSFKSWKTTVLWVGWLEWQGWLRRLAWLGWLEWQGWLSCLCRPGWLGWLWWLGLLRWQRWRDPFLSVTTELTGLQRLIRWLVQSQAYIFNASACIQQRTSSPVTLSREKPCPVGPSLCTTAPSLQKKSFYPDFSRGEGVCTQASRPTKEEGWLGSLNSHYQLKPAVIDRKIKKDVYVN